MMRFGPSNWLKSTSEEKRPEPKMRRTGPRYARKLRTDPIRIHELSESMSNFEDKELKKKKHLQPLPVWSGGSHGRMTIILPRVHHQFFLVQISSPNTKHVKAFIVTIAVIQQGVGHVGDVTFRRTVILTHHKRLCTQTDTFCMKFVSSTFYKSQRIISVIS